MVRQIKSELEHAGHVDKVSPIDERQSKGMGQTKQVRLKTRSKRNKDGGRKLLQA